VSNEVDPTFVRVLLAWLPVATLTALKSVENLDIFLPLSSVRFLWEVNISIEGNLLLRRKVGHVDVEEVDWFPNP